MKLSHTNAKKIRMLLKVFAILHHVANVAIIVYVFFL